MQSAAPYRSVYSGASSFANGNGVNRGTTNGGFGYQNGGRSTMQSANPYRGTDNTYRGNSFNRGAQPAGNSFQGNRGFAQQAPSRPASSFQGNAGRPSGGNSFHAPSAPSGGSVHGGNGGGNHGGRR